MRRLKRLAKRILYRLRYGRRARRILDLEDTLDDARRAADAANDVAKRYERAGQGDRAIRALSRAAEEQQNVRDLERRINRLKRGLDETE